MKKVQSVRRYMIIGAWMGHEKYTINLLTTIIASRLKSNQGVVAITPKMNPLLNAGNVACLRMLRTLPFVTMDPAIVLFDNPPPFPRLLIGQFPSVPTLVIKKIVNPHQLLIIHSLQANLLT